MSDPRCYVCGNTPEDCDCAAFIDCTCELSGDVSDARGCPVHGERGILAREARQMEGAAEAAYWSVISEF